MTVINESELEYRFKDSGPKYLQKGPRMNFGIVVLKAGQDFKAHYHNIMEENFYVLEGEIEIHIDQEIFHCKKGDFIHIATGKKLGEHSGFYHYTIGQRKGLEIAYSEPLYVIKIDSENNVINM